MTNLSKPALPLERSPIAMAVLMTLAPAMPALAADAVPLQLAAIEEINILGNNRQTLRSLPTMRGPVIDVPQLVSTISSATLHDRQVNTLEDALRNVAGITTQIGEGGVVNGDQFFIRGQAARNDIFTDGLRDFGAFTRDSFNFDSVSVLKGPSSTALGRGVSGGAINSGSKLAGINDFTTVAGGLGTADYGRVALDTNHAFTNTTAARLNVMLHENDAPDRDVINSHRWGLAGAAGFGIGTDSSVNVIYLHQQEDRIPDYGVPVATTSLATDIELPVSEYGVNPASFYGYAGGDTDDVAVDTLTLLVDHRINDVLSVASASKAGRYQRYFRQTVASCPAASCGDLLLDNNPATTPMASMGGPGPYAQLTTGMQNVTTLLYTQRFGGRRNEFVVGWDVSYQNNDRSQYNYLETRSAKNLLAPIHSPLPELAPGFNNVRETTAADMSVVIDDRLWLTPSFSLNAGVRLQHYQTQQETLGYPAVGAATLSSCNGAAGAFVSCLTEVDSASDLVNPKVSAMWEPSDRASVYLSWGRSSVPPGNSVGNGDALTAPGTGNVLSTADLDPEQSETIDLGIKYALFDERLLLQAGIYQTDRDNSKEIDPRSGNTIASPQPAQRLRGFELGASGTITRNLLVNFNYSHINTEVREAYSGTPAVLNSAILGKQIVFVPADSASAWATWEPSSGWMQNLKVGGGFNYQSKVYLNAQNLQETPAYTSVDMLLGYNFNKVSLALNANNLADKNFYSQVNGGRVVPAAGRNFIASLQYSF